MELSSLHISNELGVSGIGKQLFLYTSQFAKQQGASKLYISGHNAIETQHFYQRMGRVEAVEVQADKMESEPFDYQLEYEIK